MILKIIFFLIFFLETIAEDLPSNNVLSEDSVIQNFSDKEGQIPGTKVIGDFSDVKIIPREENEGLKEENEVSKNEKKDEINIDIKKDIESSLKNEIEELKKQFSFKEKRKNISKKTKKESNIHIFSFQKKYVDLQSSFVSIPSASKILAVFGAGIEVSNDKMEVDVILKSILIGPNETKIDLKDCRAWFEVWGNYNTERILGDAKHLSCRGDDGQTYQIKFQGQIRDFQDEYVGLRAAFLPKGKLAQAALQFLNGGIKGFGMAMGAANVVSSATSGGNNFAPVKTENIQNKEQYIVGKSLESASGDFLDWWINYYKGLSPTLAVEPGREIIIAIKESFEIPKDFFIGKKSNTKEGQKIGFIDEKN